MIASIVASFLLAAAAPTEPVARLFPPYAASKIDTPQSSMQKTSPDLPYYTSNCPIEIDFSFALDDFRSLPEGSWEGSWGALSAVNFKAWLPHSFTVQLGGSYGLYDWAGRSSTPFKNSKTLQQQGFITFAFSRLTPTDSGFNIGFAYDWMLNKNFGLFAVNPFFDQARGQLGYLFKGGNEIGAWGSFGILNSHKESEQLPFRFRGIAQVNLFWCHYFQTNGFAMIWAGSPYRRGLMYTGGRPGRFTLGAQFSVPVTESLSLTGTGAYMSPRGGSGIIPSRNYAADLSIGITYSFGKRRILQTPYMTIANNSLFMADTNQNF